MMSGIRRVESMKKFYSVLLAALLFTALPLVLTAAEEQEEEAGVWVDLRSPREYRQGHIEGAINIPQGEIAHRIDEFVPDLYQPIHLYGSDGAFAGLALEILMELGYQYVINEGVYQAILERQND